MGKTGGFLEHGRQEPGYRPVDERIKRLAGKIDRVLVDAPCSGLGTLRRNPDLKWRQSPQAIEELRVKQQAILASAAPTKPAKRGWGGCWRLSSWLKTSRHFF